MKAMYGKGKRHVRDRSIAMHAGGNVRRKCKYLGSQVPGIPPSCFECVEHQLTRARSWTSIPNIHDKLIAREKGLLAHRTDVFINNKQVS
jgi:hypothetical protein